MNRRRAGSWTPFFGTACLILLLLLLVGPVLAQSGPPPSNPIKQYNKACRLSLAGKQKEALAAFRLAMESGWDDLNQAESDPDLAAMRQLSGYQDLITARQATLQLLAAEKSLTLTSGQWTPPWSLAGDNSAPGLTSEPTNQPAIRLRWQPTHLEFELTLPPAQTELFGTTAQPPWQGGPALVLTMAGPEPNSSFESSAHFVLAFGLDKSTPAGGIYVHGGGWQRVLELDPQIQIHSQNGQLVMTGSIPWRTCKPFHPLVDPQLGFNAALRLPDDDNSRKYHLLSDPAAFQPQTDVRRFVPLNFDRASESRESVMGKINQTIGQGGPVTVTLAVVSGQTGTGQLKLNFTDNLQKSVLPGGPVFMPVDLEKGFNTLEQQADFSDLDPGLYLVRAELTFPSGQTGIWSEQVLQLGTDWPDEMASRVTQLSPVAQPTGRHYLSLLQEALGQRHPRTNPGPVATTLAQLDKILDQATETGSPLPMNGTVILAYDGPQGQPRLCTVYLPKNWQDRGPVNPVLLLAEVSGLENQLMHRLGRSYEFEGHLTGELRSATMSPVYVLPHLPPAKGQVHQIAVEEAEACLQFMSLLFQSQDFSLCGIDFHGGTALRLQKENSERFHGLLIMAGRRTDPWPQANAEFLTEQLSPAPENLPITWIDFVQETKISGQGTLLLQVVTDAGYQLEPVQSVRGGLSMTQVADRVVLWAESLR